MSQYHASQVYCVDMQGSNLHGSLCIAPHTHSLTLLISRSPIHSFWHTPHTQTNKKSCLILHFKTRLSLAWCVCVWVCVCVCVCVCCARSTICTQQKKQLKRSSRSKGLLGWSLSPLAAKVSTSDGSVWTNDSLTRTNRPDSQFQFALVLLVCSPKLDSQLHLLVAESLTLTRESLFVHWLCLAVKTRGLRRHESQLGNNIPIPNIKRSSAERNLVNVVLIDDWCLHHCTIVICLRMRTREELSLTDSAGNHDWTGNVTEQTNKQTIWTILLGKLTRTDSSKQIMKSITSVYLPLCKKANSWSCDWSPTLTAFDLWTGNNVS